LIPSNIGKSPENATTPGVLNNLARKAIEMQLGSLWLRGEVTDLYMAQSGHAYFSLKDNSSSIKCTFFKQFNFKRTVIKNGDNLLVFGLATLYEERGTFQLKVERVETSGIGDMAKAFAELKIKLEALGYFSPEKKQTIPAIINSLGIVTSKSSAAITDVLNVIKRRNPLLEVKIYHASVQGDKAVEEIIDALLRADINKHDVILLTRGGGSEEDLWTFNDVSIAQTLFNLSTICVSAIGHERDTSISDLVADVSAITPTAAAELLTPDLAKLSLRIAHNQQTIEKLMANKLNNYNQQLDIIYHRLEKSHPKNSINNEKQKTNNRYQKLKLLIQQSMQARNNSLAIKQNNLKHFDFKVDTKKFDINFKFNKISNLMSKKFEQKTSVLKNLAQNINTLSPLATLSRGYSITLQQKTKTVISRFDQVDIGEKIETIIDSGKIISTITEINETIK